MSNLNQRAVDAALRKTIEFLDYDTHKLLEGDEETGEDTYAEHVERFITEYGKALGPVVPDSHYCEHSDLGVDDYGATRCNHCGLVF